MAGFTAALASARAGYRTALIAPDSPTVDERTTALMNPSIALLDRLGVWQGAVEAAAPLRSMRILDGTLRLLRAPTVTFHASELGLEAFGYNIPNMELLAALREAVSATAALSYRPARLDHIELNSQAATLHLSDGSRIDAGLVAAADGRNSPLRRSAGISAREWRYPQTALVLNFTHEFNHAGTSNEFHTEDGPFTQVPLPGRRSSLVWAMKPADAVSRAALPREQLSGEIEMRMQSMLGKVQIDSPVQRFDFRGMIAASFARDRVLLVGEAGHAFPPIGAQGLNLGLRDVVDFADVIRSGLDRQADVSRRYDRARRLDVTSRTYGVDLLNRSLLSGFLPVQLLRSAGLSLLHHVGPLRHIIMREGISPGAGLRLNPGHHPPE